LNTTNQRSRTTPAEPRDNRLSAASPYGSDPRRVTQLPVDVVRWQTAKPLPAADTIAIYELLHRVYLAEDSRDREALRQTITHDFVQDHSIVGRVTGRDAFADWVLSIPDFFDGRRHMAINIAVAAGEPGEAFAVHFLFVFELFAAGREAAGLPRVLAHGVVRDRLVRAEGTWLIAHRIYDQFALFPGAVPDAERRAQGALVLTPEK
jgi:hypothetical protein